MTAQRTKKRSAPAALNETEMAFVAGGSISHEPLTPEPSLSVGEAPRQRTQPRSGSVILAGDDGSEIMR